MISGRRAGTWHGACQLLPLLSTGEFSAADGLDEYATKAPTDTSAELEYGVRGKQLQLQLDVSVGWTPARPADTLLPSGLTGVTVGA